MAPGYSAGATSGYNFKKITVVPPAKDFIDATLSKTQRKTPTVIHKHLPIARIRGFYLRKVKYTQQNFHDRLEMILSEFPRLEDIHPFYADLMNVLYDRDHYKLALGQISTAKHLIDAVARDYGRLLKFGDSLYRCKLLKTAALGRMCTIVKRQKPALEYLEEVRQHLSRLPSIDPTQRTIILAGFPNVGKSSLINLLTRANVEVQPYAFTTKSLYVGHMDYKYLNWQVIDTPGILDHELEERNAIEWQSVTALAHLKAAIVYIIDISEQCGTPIQTQIDLFMKIKPLFANKPVFVMLNKIDVKPFDQLSDENKALLTKFQEQENVTFHHTSNVSKEGIMNMRNEACDQLLLQRVESKLRGKKTENILNRLHVAMPEKRDNVERPEFIPDKACVLRAEAANRPKVELLREKELELDDEYVLDLRRTWDLKNPEEAYDAIPEIWEGKNIADFVDPDIIAKLDALEKEEEEREKNEFYKLDGLNYDSDDMEIHEMAKRIRKKRKINKIEARLEDKTCGRSKLVRKNKEALEEKMTELGIGEHIREGAGHYKETRDRGRSVARKRRKMEDGEGMDVDTNENGEVRTRSKSRNRSQSHIRGKTRDKSGIRDDQEDKARKMMKKSQKGMNLMAMVGEADRRYQEKKPKHLFSGKRGKGTADRR